MDIEEKDSSRSKSKFKIDSKLQAKQPQERKENRPHFKDRSLSKKLQNQEAPNSKEQDFYSERKPSFKSNNARFNKSAHGPPLGKRPNKFENQDQGYYKETNFGESSNVKIQNNEGKPENPYDFKQLHPSWQAKIESGQQGFNIVPFQGKKIKL